MFWNRKGLFTDVWIVILLIVFLPALAHAEAYDGMCADTYDASLPPNCAEGVFEQVSVTDTTDCECEFGGGPGLS